MGKAIATKDSVEQVAEELIASGIEPTANLIREHIGGGSFSTISKLLRDYRNRANSDEGADKELPEAIARIVKNAAVRITEFLETESKTKIEEALSRAKKKENILLYELEQAEREITSNEDSYSGLEESFDKALNAAALAERERDESKAQLEVAQQRIDELQSLLIDTKERAKTELARERGLTEKAEQKAQAAIEEAAELRGRITAFKGAE